MSRCINLNADLGESYGAWQMGRDAELLALVDSASLACGFHAGDPLVMRETLRRARSANVSVGAHPSFPDLQGFGRRPMQLPPAELEAALIYQMAALSGMARCEGLRMGHVKPHGALSNMACRDARLARTVVDAILAFDARLVLLAPACSELSLAGHGAGLKVVEEVFADRAYLDDGSLMPRERPDALIEDPREAVDRALCMLQTQALVTVSGQRLPTPIGSICVHGDTHAAVDMARLLRARLLAEGWQLQPLPLA